MAKRPKDHLSILKTDVEEGVTYCYRLARRWAITYYSMRGALIFFSALASAQAINAFVVMKDAQPILALVVTILATLDAWVKPGDKYRALYIANDEYNLLRQELEFIDPRDMTAVITKLEQYKRIALRLQKAVLP